MGADRATTARRARRSAGCRVEGRGSLPFALLHGESLVAVASWALGEAGVELLDFTASWAGRAGPGDRARGPRPALPRHARRPSSPRRSGGRRRRHGRGRGPPGDRHRRSGRRGGVLGETVDRAGLLAVASPVVLPAAVVAALDALPSTDDLADLVAALRADHEVVLLEAPRAGPPGHRRVRPAAAGGLADPATSRRAAARRAEVLGERDLQVRGRRGHAA